MSKYPILFKSNETEFKTHGIGVLSDAVQCDVTEQLNGIFELNMIYPSNGTYLKEFKNSRIIYADASRELGYQPFRICRITKTLNGFINVYAQHISYDLGGIQLPPFETLGTVDGFQKIKQYSTTQNDYSFSTTVYSETDNTFITETPKSVRAYLLGEKESFLQAYGGEFTFDRFNVNHSPMRGSDKGFRVKYGVNLVDLNQEDSIEKMYTGIYPYYKDTNLFMDLTESYDPNNPHEVDVSKLSEKIMYAVGAFEKIKIANVDLSSLFEEPPISSNDLREIAKKYMSNNKIGIPTINIDVRFEPLRKSSEYPNVIFLEDVFLGDTIHVDFVKLGVSAIGRINAILYDSIRHKNKSVSIGDPQKNVADTVLSIMNKVNDSATKNDVKNVLNKIPTNTSDLNNDSKFATETFVTNKIAEAQLGGDDSEIDLSGFATKDEVLVDLEQTTKSTESGGTNVWTATFGDGRKSTLEVRNGEKGVDGKTPYIQNGYWYIDGTNTGVKAEGKDGANGINGTNGTDGKTPYIKNGYWWIGETDTGVKAEGVDGKDADLSKFYTMEQVDDLIKNAINSLDIPTHTSDLTNDSGYVTESKVQDLIDKALGNDSGGDEGGGEGGGDNNHEPEIDAIYASETPFESKTGNTTACLVENALQDVGDVLYIPLHIATYHPIQYVQIYISPDLVGIYNMSATDASNNELGGSWEFNENINTFVFTPSGEIPIYEMYIYGKFTNDDGTYEAFPIQAIEIKA